MLDTVIKLVDMAVRVVGIDVPVAPRHVPPNPLDADALFLKEVGAVHHLGQRSCLPGNLVDGDLALAAATAAGRYESVHDIAGEQHKGMVVAAVGEEKAPSILDVGQLLP